MTKHIWTYPSKPSGYLNVSILAFAYDDETYSDLSWDSLLSSPLFTLCGGLGCVCNGPELRVPMDLRSCPWSFMPVMPVRWASATVFWVFLLFVCFFGWIDLWTSWFLPHSSWIVLDISLTVSLYQWTFMNAHQSWDTPAGVPSHDYFFHSGL